MEDVYLSILKQYWGYDGFRGIQRDIIESIGNGRDTLGLMPTGGGKSITFQVPALSREGLCIVVTPLIALMKDQVRHLRERGIKAAAVYSGLSREEIIVALENCIFGNYKFLYVSPERLATDIFQAKVRHMPVSFLTVDEAHCISQWGYDFRPSYTRIADIRRILPDIPILALTATATPEVVEDIQRQLGFRERNVFRMSFERKNLAYIVRHTEDKFGELVHILRSTEGSAIVYTRSRRNTREAAERLIEAGFTATYYHAGLDHADKDARQQAWQAGQARIMVATNAFGMGIDKPDVRLVAHLDLPDSIEAYFQEAGRAGRDGLPAYAVLLYQKFDRTRLMKRIPDTFPAKDSIREVYEHLCYYYQMAMGDGYNVTREFDLNEFCRNFKHFPVQADSALRLLERAGYIEYTEEQENASRLHVLLRKDELYRIHELPSQQETLLQWVLRSYGGLFSDYVFIDERRIATLSGIPLEEVYFGLLSLSRARILHYIPRKRTPYITFRTKRIEADRLVFPPAIYDERKKSFEERIEAILHYAEEMDFCRSKVLLHYFGEKDAPDCGVCDVCRQKARRTTGKSLTDEQIAASIMQILGDGQEHLLTEFVLPAIPRERTALILHRLIEEETVRLHDGILSLPPSGSPQP